MRRRLFGLDKKQVDEYLESLYRSHMDKIEELQKKIEQRSKDKEELAHRLDELRSSLEAAVKNKDFMSFVLNRTKAATELLRKYSREEISAALKAAEEATAAQDEKIKLLKDEIKSAKYNYSELIEKLTDVLHQKEDGKQSDDQKISDGKVLKVFPHIVKKLNISELDKAATAPVNSSKQAIQAEKSEKTEINEQITKTAEADESFWGLDKQKMTADGIMLDRLQKSFLNTDNDKNTVKSTVSNTNAFHGASANIRINLQEADFGGGESSFWDDERNGNTGTAEDAGIPQGSPAVKSKGNSIVSNTKPSVAANQTATAEPADTTGSVSQSVSAVKEKDNGKPQGLHLQGKPVESKAITEEINMIRHKYIIGKLVGEDLHGFDGKLIAARNSVITAEIVEKAEQNGKLAELIVNMILPGFDN